MENILKEYDIRAFLKCSEFYAYGGIVDLTLKTMMLEYVYIKIVLDQLKYQENFDFNYSLNANLKNAIKALDLSSVVSSGQQEEYKRHTSLYMYEMFKILNPKIYIPIFGPFEYPVTVSKSVIHLNISSLLSVNQNLDKQGHIYHAITFSPYVNTKDMENDLVQQIKLFTMSLSNPFRTLVDKPRIKLHIFSSSKDTTLNYTSLEYKPSTQKNPWAKYIEQVVKTIESNYHYPIVPCNYSCKFKSQCGLLPTRRRKC